MDPELLPVQVTNLKHAMLGKKRVRMVTTNPSSHQASKPLLIPKQGARKCHIPTALKVPPHQEAVLQVWEDQPIVE